MHWILYILIAAAWFVTYRKGRRWGIIVIICGIGIYLAINYLLTPRNVAYPENPLSAEYRRNLNYLLNTSMQAPPDLSNISGGFLGSHLAIVDENDFPLLTKKLRYALYNAAHKNLLFHSFVLGGMNIRDIDQPLLAASKKLRNYRQGNIEIVLVAPTTVSAETKATLEKRGIKIRLVGSPSRNHFQ